MQTITVWKQGLAFASTFDGHNIELNGATGDDGMRLGFSPKALLLSGLAGCSGIDVVDILTKMKVSFENLTIITEAEQTDEHPRVFKEIYICYRIKTDKENEAKVQRAVSLSLEKYCGVSAMLSKHSVIRSKIEIN